MAFDWTRRAVPDTAAALTALTALTHARLAPGTNVFASKDEWTAVQEPSRAPEAVERRRKLFAAAQDRLRQVAAKAAAAAGAEQQQQPPKGRQHAKKHEVLHDLVDAMRRDEDFRWMQHRQHHYIVPAMGIDCDPAHVEANARALAAAGGDPEPVYAVRFPRALRVISDIDSATTIQDKKDSYSVSVPPSDPRFVCDFVYYLDERKAGGGGKEEMEVDAAAAAAAVLEPLEPPRDGDDLLYWRLVMVRPIYDLLLKRGVTPPGGGGGGKLSFPGTEGEPAAPPLGPPSDFATLPTLEFDPHLYPPVADADSDNDAAGSDEEQEPARRPQKRRQRAMSLEPEKIDAFLELFREIATSLGEIATCMRAAKSPKIE